MLEPIWQGLCQRVRSAYRKFYKPVIITFFNLWSEAEQSKIRFLKYIFVFSTANKYDFVVLVGYLLRFCCVTDSMKARKNSVGRGNPVRQRDPGARRRVHERLWAGVRSTSDLAPRCIFSSALGQPLQVAGAKDDAIGGVRIVSIDGGGRYRIAALGVVSPWPPADCGDGPVIPFSCGMSCETGKGAH